MVTFNQTLEGTPGSFKSAGSNVAMRLPTYYYKRDDHMAIHKLADKIITTALDGSDTDHGVCATLRMLQQVLSVAVNFKFTYGSGGTTADAYLQTSFDGGTSWVDVANFHVTTGSDSKVINLSSLTPVTTPFAPQDGAISNNTCKDGVLGELWRVKLKSSGTYAGSSRMQVFASFKTAAIGG